MILLVLTLFISASWAQNITVQLRDSDGNILPDADMATLCYYLGGWNYFANDGNGNFQVPEALFPRILRMGYNATSEDRLIGAAPATPIVFNTITFTAVAKDIDGNILAGGLYYQSQYTNTGIPSGQEMEVLPTGTYRVTMKFHTGQVDKQILFGGDPQVVEFMTTTILPRLIDCEGFVAQSLEDPAWHLWHGCVGPCDGCPFNSVHPALIGSTQRFRVFYNGQVLADETFIVPPTPVVLTMAVPCTFSFRSFPNTIGILVWHDADGDGTQTGEQDLGIAGVTVKLTKPNGTLITEGVTNALGIVTFEDYPMNQPMKVRFVLPNGYAFTNSSGNIFNPMNSDASNTGNTNAFQGTGEFIGFIDCGLVYSAAKTTSINYSEEFSLYPNPASGVTSFTYYLSEDANVSISAFDLAGKEVAIFDESMKAAGQNTSEFDVSTLEPGIYFVKFVVGDNVRTERIVVTH